MPIAHVTFGTNDLERGARFYDAIMAEFGGARSFERAEHFRPQYEQLFPVRRLFGIQRRAKGLGLREQSEMRALYVAGHARKISPNLLGGENHDRCRET